MPPYIWIENDHFVGTCTTIKAFQRKGPAEKDFEPWKVLPTLVEKTTAYIKKQAKSKKPFFIYMPLNSPHTPIAPSPAFKGKSHFGIYADFVMETDWAIGEVIKTVDALGLGDNTLIIVTADNGCSPAAARAQKKEKNIAFLMGEKNPTIDPNKHYPSIGFRGHKADIYEGGHRVPFIVRWNKKVKAGSVCEQTICLVDFFATTAEILKTSYPDSVAEDSVSFLPYLLGKTKQPLRKATVHHSINGSFAIRQGHWKLSFCPGSGGWSKPRPPRKGKKIPEFKQWIQLYDLSKDIAETTNVAEAHPEVVKQLTALAEQYIKEGRSTPGTPQKNTGKTFMYPRWLQKIRAQKN